MDSETLSIVLAVSVGLVLFLFLTVFGAARVGALPPALVSRIKNDAGHAVLHTMMAVLLGVGLAALMWSMVEVLAAL